MASAFRTNLDLTNKGNIACVGSLPEEDVGRVVLFKGGGYYYIKSLDLT